MSETVIHVDKISKVFKLGTISGNTFKEDLRLWWLKHVAKKKDAMALLNPDNPEMNSGYNWALRNISFDVKKGEVLGIVGTNGAGKSTLLKILSKVIRPTTGEIKGKGRIASLLEVGTGFHGELTGRENIFLNGNILGMSNREIRKKFDDIVTFAGVEKFIDTPVKRYSSGMYVRLAFAVAIYLEPEIMIIDEVLAVGDSEFQKKCLAKMREASEKEDRTVLFVSHNMQAVQSLCTRAILLRSGQLVENGSPAKVVKSYLSFIKNSYIQNQWDNINQAPGNDMIRIKKVNLQPEISELITSITVKTAFRIKLEFWNLVEKLNLTICIHLFTSAGELIFETTSQPRNVQGGIIEAECAIPGDFLNTGLYYISVLFVKDNAEEMFYFEECLFFEVEQDDEDVVHFGKRFGYIRPRFPFTIKQKEALVETGQYS
jgi:lipopolysaccharide transport system ATP-binding protein